MGLSQAVLVVACVCGLGGKGCWEAGQPSAGSAGGRPWPAVGYLQRPWAYWWWMGSAVEEANITSQLETYRAAGMGGVHVIPIYGAKGYEDRYVEYLSPRWMQLLGHAVKEARRLGMGVDMTTGTGWCFGGPNVPDRLANARVRWVKHKLAAGQRVEQRFERRPQAAVAYGPGGQVVELTGRVGADGQLDWAAPDGDWTVYVVWQEPSGRRVKRAAPGGHGWMLNPFCREAIVGYLERFERAFERYDGPPPRAMYHDSYEYVCDWSPDLFDEFQRRRGYRLQEHLPALFGQGPAETVARVKHDYRQTISDMMADNFTRTWVQWCHDHGMQTRDQAHGSPANLLDLYAEADIPETEFFRFDRNPLVAKFASSAAHVAGRKLVACETGTWLAEHFHVTLGHLKPLIDGLFVSGINHIIYHGTCYSPADTPWPGWLFYASTQMNPRNAIWHDVPALNAYIARCQAVLQSGQPDNDLLLYWPIHDLWQTADGLTQNLTVHNTKWLTGQRIGSAAKLLWTRGYAFDYVSDRQLQEAKVTDGGRIELPGGSYAALVVPRCRFMPVSTLRCVVELAEAGATVIFRGGLPDDVPGLHGLRQRRERLGRLIAAVTGGPANEVKQPVGVNQVGMGRVLVGTDLEAMLRAAGVPREPAVDHPGLYVIRRKVAGGRYYFIAHQSEQFVHNPSHPPIDGWVELATAAGEVLIMDPLTGSVGRAAIGALEGGRTAVYLQLRAGQSLVLRTRAKRAGDAAPWPYVEPSGPAVPLRGTWRVQFVEGGPKLPGPFQTDRLESWTELGGDEARRFAGTARYTLEFTAPDRAADRWLLELGRVAHSAGVRLNGRELGVVFCRPFRLLLPPGAVRPGRNLLELDVTNLSANRIRDLDRRRVPWRVFHDINFVNVRYQPFDASDWPVDDSGLLGPVQLVPLRYRAVPSDPPR